MAKVNIIFPHQLFADSELIQNSHPVYLVEEYLFFRQYQFHKQKIAFHRMSMKAYAEYLDSRNVKVRYVDATDERSDIRKLIASIKSGNIQTIHYIDPTDCWLEERIRSSAEKAGITLKKYDSKLFLNKPEDLSKFFKPAKKKFYQTKFYISERKKRNILIGKEEKPEGGKWSFDSENRKKYPSDKKVPELKFPKSDSHFAEAKKYVEKHFDKNPGSLNEEYIYPHDFKSSRQWLDMFLNERFKEFGHFEDAILKEEIFLHHSVLTPMLNTGLITVDEVIRRSLEVAESKEIPINSLEGFIRQLIGWREFIRGIYEVKGGYQRTKNFWGFNRKIPASFYNGSTGIDPIDDTIRKVLKTAYCHHIERLMILGNFMLLCEFDPDEVYRWFMELFIDAYDWVMVPNVYGMSQFADGGLMSTKPYISGSNYIRKMSDYKKGDWQEVWDSLFWRFMHVHRDFFLKNPRLGMLVGNFDKMDTEKQESLIETAENYLKSLN